MQVSEEEVKKAVAAANAKTMMSNAECFPVQTRDEQV